MSRDVVWLADQNFASDPLSTKSHKTQDYDRNRDDGQGIDRNCSTHSSDDHDSDTESDIVTDDETISNSSYGDDSGSGSESDSDSDSDSDSSSNDDDSGGEDGIELGGQKRTRRRRGSATRRPRQNRRPSPELRGGEARSNSTGTHPLDTEAASEEAGHNGIREIGASDEDGSPGPTGRPSRGASRSTVDITGDADPRDYIRNLTELGSIEDVHTLDPEPTEEDATSPEDAEDQGTDDWSSTSRAERTRAVSFEMPLADDQPDAAHDSHPSGRGSRTRRQLETHIPDAPGQEPLPSTRSGGRISANTGIMPSTNPNSTLFYI